MSHNHYDSFEKGTLNRFMCKHQGNIKNYLKIDWADDLIILFNIEQNKHLPVLLIKISTTPQCRIFTFYPFMKDTFTGVYKSVLSDDSVQVLLSSMCRIYINIDAKRISIHSYGYVEYNTFDYTRFLNKAWLIENNFLPSNDNNVSQLYDELNEIRGTLNQMTTLLEQLLYAPPPVPNQSKFDIAKEHFNNLLNE